MRTTEMTPLAEPKEISPVSGLLSALFLELDAGDIAYGVIGNYETLPAQVEGDVDVLVHPEHQKAFRAVLLSVASSSAWSLVKELSRFGFHSFWLKSDGADEYLQVDIWTTLHWKGLPLIRTDEVLSGRIRHGVLEVLSPAAEAALLVLKGILYEGRVKPRYHAGIVQAAEEHGEALKAHLAWALSTEDAAQLCAAIRAEAWEDVERSRGRMIRALRWRALRRSPMATLRRTVQFACGHVRAYLGRRNGMFLVLVGPDGSGKSTIAAKLSEHLAGLFRYRRYYHGRFGMLPRLSAIKGVLTHADGRSPSEEPAECTTDESASRPHSRARILVYITYYSLDYLLGHLLIRRQEGLGNLVVFDRYFYDWFVQSYTEKTPRVLLPLLKCILPRPDLVVYLHNAPEVVHQRKPELSVAQIARQEARFREVLKHISCSTTIRTDLPADAIVSQIADHVAEKMRARLRKHVSEHPTGGERSVGGTQNPGTEKSPLTSIAQGRMKRFPVKYMHDGRAMLNLACGGHMHSEWNNLDFSPLARLAPHRRIAKLLNRIGILSSRRYQRLLETDDDIICWDLRKGIPFGSDTFDVVYHSHFLEHLDRHTACGFLEECHRVLKPSGIFRVVVPDLQLFCADYLDSYTQLTRSPPPSDESLKQHQGAIIRLIGQMVVGEPRGTAEQPPFIRVLERRIRGNNVRIGEAHRWMYDRFSLPPLLREVGFSGIQIESFTSGAIEGWASFGLDIGEDAQPYKSRSLYVEARK